MARRRRPCSWRSRISGELQGLEAALRDALPEPPLDRYLRGAAQGALWIAARTGLARAWRDAGRKADDPLLLRIEAALAPGALLGGRAGCLGGGATLYGCELTAGVPRADEVALRLAGGSDADAAAGDISAALAVEEELGRRAEGAVAVARVRELLVGAVVAAEAAGQVVGTARLRELLVGPGALATALAEDGSRKALWGELASNPAGGRRRRRAGAGGPRAQGLEGEGAGGGLRAPP